MCDLQVLDKDALEGFRTALFALANKAEISGYDAADATVADAVWSIGLGDVKRLAVEFNLQPRNIMVLALQHQVWPKRFIRNKGTLSAHQQALLLQKRVAIIGCGGLGGYVAVFLARYGVGGMTLCDADTFEESNLNRQAHCHEGNLGQPKATVLGQYILRVSSHIEIRSCVEMAHVGNLPTILQGAQLVVDCLDNYASRQILACAALEMGLPFIHGCLAGEEGFAMLCEPGRGSFEKLHKAGFDRGAENKMGAPSLTPAAVALLQANLAVRRLLGNIQPNEIASLWHLDLEAFALEKFII